MNRTSISVIRTFLGGLLLIASSALSLSSPARSEDPHAVITIGMRRVFEKVIPAFEATSGRKFRIEYASTIEIAQRLAGGERAGFVVASRSGIDKLIAAGKVRQEDEFVLGQSRIVVAVPAGRTIPDVLNAEAVKNALLSAGTVSYTDPASGGPSGIQMARVLDRLGILQQVNAKTRFPAAGGPVGEILARSEADIGIQQSVELTSYPGVAVVGPLPPEMQTVTKYVAAIPTDSPDRDAATSLVNYLRSPDGQRILHEGGLEAERTTVSETGPRGGVPAYYIADFEVTDREGIKPYSANVEATFKPFGGRFIVRGGDPVPLEGQSPKGRLVIIEFDSMENAQAWYNSPAYTQLRPTRQRSGRSNVYILQGLAK